MKKGFLAFLVVAVMGFMVLSVFGQQGAAAGPGEAKFKQNCTICHPDGGNIINPQKTLSKKDREANNVKTAADIVKIMRNPGPGMNKFDDKTISDKDAMEIAEYVMQSFK